MVSQGSVFTIHTLPAKPLEDFEGKIFEKGRLDIELLIRWEIPKDGKTSIIEQLDSYGVNRRTLFPDLDGLAAGLKESRILWS